MGKVNTGIKDRKGKEIFEGDIILRHRNDFPVVEVVEFDSSWVLKGEDDIKSLDSYREYVEVIGNIYETPELLEK